MPYLPEVIPRGFTITREDAEKATLLIHFGLDQVSFCILDGRGGQVLMITDAAVDARSLKKLDNLLETYSILTYPFAETKISIDTFHFTFIPLIHYNNALFPEYGRFAGAGSMETAELERIPAGELANVYAIDTEFREALNTRFGNPRIFTQVSPLLNGARRILQSNVSTNVFVNIKLSAFEIALIREDGFQYYNIFRYSNAGEFTYFLMMVIRHFRLDETDSVLTVSGHVEDNHPLYMILRKYFGRVLTAPAKKIFNLPEPLRSELPYRFYTLFSLSLCQ